MPNRNQRGRGSPKGPSNSPGRGRGSGYRGRGRGRGNGRGSGRGGYYTLDDMDQMYTPSEMSNRGTPPPRGRRGGFRGRVSQHNSGTNTPTRGRDSPHGRGRGTLNDHQSPRGRGRGRGGSKLRPDAPLSSLLYQERPFLRPITFVPSVHAKTLFQEEEEILKPIVEEVGDEEGSHVPTADRVFRVFSGNIPTTFSSASEDDNEDELVEIDFNDLGKLLDVPARPVSRKDAELAIIEEKFTGIYIKPTTPVTSESLMTGDNAPTSTGDKSENTPTFTNEESTTLSNEPSTLHEMPAHADNDVPITIDASPIDILSTHLDPSVSGIIAIDNNDTTSPDATTIPTVPDTLEYEPTGFYIDTEPSRIDSPHPPLPIDDSDEEVIVYVAPHPRSRQLTPVPPEDRMDTSSLPSTSILTGTTHTHLHPSSTPPPKNLIASASTPIPVPPAPTFDSVSFSFADSPAPRKPRQIPAFTARSRAKAQIKLRKREARAARKRMESQAMFGLFGAIMSEAQLRGGNMKHDPRWHERRQDDSDIDWGDEGGSGGNMGDTGLAEGMELDPDLEIDADAMKSFLKGMGPEGERFVTMDDIADQERMRMEDEDEREVGSSGDDDDESTGDGDGITSDEDEEADAVVNAEENILVAEPDDIDLTDDSDDEFDSDDEVNSPRTGFQARLERLRAHARGKQRRDTRNVSLEDVELSDSDDDDMFVRNLTWAEEDEEFIEHIEALLDENEAVLTGRDRKQRNKLFHAVRNGTFEDVEGFSPARKKKDKYKDIPVELQEQWHKDRQKKAERKQARELARLEAALDPLSVKKGGKKGRKAMLAAARLTPTIKVIPNRVIDIVTLVQQIRRFIENIGGPSTMSCPPTNKATRKSIHEIAIAFNLKSQSKGKGDSRYTTLIKTTRTGNRINEDKLARIMRGHGRGSGDFTVSKGGRERGQGRHAVPKHRDGDEVGKAAPKIGESNIGFKMLASMGWSEGDRIGITGGLDAPLTAIIKNTKLGLGASK